MTLSVPAKAALLLLFIFTYTHGIAQTQKPFVLNGYIRDKQTGEALINATINVGNTGVYAQSNAYGFYSLSLPEGKHEIEVTYAGYTSFKTTVTLTKNVSVDLTLTSVAASLEQVTVVGERKLKRTNTIGLGIQQLSAGQIKKIPAFMGEPDIIKALLTLPGITSIGEGASGFNVRGGNVDENLILMDEAPVFNSSHLLGFFSVFNPDAVKNVTLYKGAFPAEYGGRTSSVLDIRMKDGNNQKMAVTGGIGNIFSRLAIEGPLQKDKSSFIIAGRRSYIDVLSKPFLPAEDRNNTLYFYDFTAKANYEINKKNTVYLSGYLGRDVFGLGDEASFKWGNTTATLRWNHLFNPKLFLNTSLYYSKYNYSLGFSSPEGERDESYDWNSNIKTFGFKPTLTWFYNNKHQFKTGFNLVYYDFYPGQGVSKSEGAENAITLNKRYGSELGIFVEDTWKLSQKLNIQAGIRLNQYAYLGNTTIYRFRDTTPNVRKPLENEEKLKSRKPVNSWIYLEPRLSARYTVQQNLFLKAAYGRTSQYLHLLSNTASPSPVDLYFPSTNNIVPSVTDQFSVGIVGVPKKLGLELSAEFFYKDMNGVLDYIDNANLELNQLVEGDLLTGKGKAYGAEFEVKKETGDWQGWVNYTWSRSLRKTPGISNEDWYVSRYDRTHVINVSVSYTLNERWDFAGSFNYGTGAPATFPDTRFDIQGLAIPYNSTGKRNNYRLPAYHRMDLSATRKGKQTKRIKKEWVFGVYNVYARQNAYSIYFQRNEDNPAQKEAVRLSIIGSIIPSITLNFKF